MHINTTDRWLRIFAGSILLIFWGIGIIAGFFGAAAGITGIFLVVTGYLRYCPILHWLQLEQRETEEKNKNNL